MTATDFEDHKCERLEKIAKKYGWETQIVSEMEDFEESHDLNDIIWKLYCIRGSESISCWWKGNLYQEGLYAFGTYRTNPARSGAIIKLLKDLPDQKKMTKINAVDRSPVNTTLSQEQIAEIRDVPWEDSNAPAFDILVGVIGKTITWVKKSIYTDSGYETKIQPCPKESNLGKAHFRVKTTSAGKRVLEWSNSFGFQACYIDDIIDVS